MKLYSVDKMDITFARCQLPSKHFSVIFYITYINLVFTNVIRQIIKGMEISIIIFLKSFVHKCQIKSLFLYLLNSNYTKPPTLFGLIYLFIYLSCTDSVNVILQLVQLSLVEE